MVRLGVFDADDCSVDIPSYLRKIHEPSMWNAKGAKFRADRDGEWITPKKLPGEEVTEVQRFLKSAGFFPLGKVDGLCGYRTHCSIRLFQEYVRTVEGDSTIGSPDGIFGSRSVAAMERWQREGIQADWLRVSATDPDPEYARWMQLLERVRTHYAVNPTVMLMKAREFSGPTDTLPVEEWDFDPQRIHLIGIRRNEAIPGKRVNDDLYILLVNGLVFKFFGTTDPGKAAAGFTAPFLVQGQHRYRFGWHKQSNMDRCYPALKPLQHGVLVIRSGERDDPDLTEADILGGRAEANPTINVHWGGRGVSNWSQGCQAICGKGYINHQNETTDCSDLAASRYIQLGLVNDAGLRWTRGAYTTLVDLVAAFSGDVHALSYMLLYERDLDLLPQIGVPTAKQILDRIS